MSGGAGHAALTGKVRVGQGRAAAQSVSQSGTQFSRVSRELVGPGLSGAIVWCKQGIVARKPGLALVKVMKRR